ncbi:MAG: TetR family transcriptional regulator [Clostridiales bacterium]|nr:TetR family transcriptional regulator [Clostridiales bacterium]MCF8021420.1 TetR family transcriptional regulator [Clostridiales bacterium]
MPKIGMEEIRREQILQAAYRCVAKNSINGARMKDIAREANISQGVIHYYFETKENLLNELLAWSLKEYLEGALNKISYEKDPVKRLETLFLYEEQIVKENPSIVEVFYDFWVQGTKQFDIRKKMKEQFELYRNFIYKLVNEGVKTGAFKEEALNYVPGLAVSLLEGFAIQQIIDPNSFDPTMLSKKSVDILLQIMTK